MYDRAMSLLAATRRYAANGQGDRRADHRTVVQRHLHARDADLKQLLLRSHCCWFGSGCAPGASLGSERL